MTLADMTWGERTLTDVREDPRTRAELLPLIDASWNRLWETADGLSKEQLTGPRDAAGWSAKDHLAHLAAWERSMVFLFRGLPRHEGLGVEESLYQDHDNVDAINAAIYENVKDLPPDVVLENVRSTHGQMLDVLNRLSDEDLQRPYQHFLPNEPGRTGDDPIIWWVEGNTFEHFDLHLGYIEQLVGSC